MEKIKIWYVVEVYTPYGLKYLVNNDRRGTQPDLSYSFNLSEAIKFSSKEDLMIELDWYIWRNKQDGNYYSYSIKELFT